MEPDLHPPSNSRAKVAWDAFVAQIGLVNFPEVNAERLDFRGASFRGMPFYGIFASARLEGVDFTDAEPGWSFFGGAHAEGANFSNAYLKKAEFGDAQLVAATFDGCNATKSGWGFAHASRASFVGSQLYNCHFYKTDFRFAKFMNTNLNGTSFDGCYLYGARFDGATGTISTEWAADVGAAEPELLSGDRLLEWLHAQGGTELKAREPKS